MNQNNQDIMNIAVAGTDYFGLSIATLDGTSY